MELAKRYVPRWSNGYWRVFDLYEYKPAMTCHLKVECTRHCNRLNKS